MYFTGIILELAQIILPLSQQLCISFNLIVDSLLFGCDVPKFSFAMRQLSFEDRGMVFDLDAVSNLLEIQCGDTDFLCFLVDVVGAFFL